MRRGLLVTLAIILILAGVLALLAMTPVGHVPARRLIERLVSSASGYTLEVGELSGNLLSKIVLDDVLLSSPSGVPLVAAERLALDFELLPLARRTVSVPLLHLEEVETSFLIDSEGVLLGWSERIALPSDSTASPASWTIDSHLEIDRIRATYADSGTGIRVDADLTSLTADGGLDALDAALSGRVVYNGHPFSDALDAQLDLVGRLQGTTVSVTSLEIASEPVTLTASGGLMFPEEGLQLDADAAVHIDAAAAGVLFGREGLAGGVSLVGGVDGPVGFLRYDASIFAPELTVAAVDLREVAAEVSGAGAEVELRSFDGRALGGTVVASGALTTKTDEAPLLRIAASGEGLDLSLVPSLEVSGQASLELDAKVPLGVMSSAAGTLSMGVRDLGFGQYGLGDAALEATATDGHVNATASCCSTLIELSALLGRDRVDSLSVVLDTSDLAAVAVAFGDSALTGRGGLTVKAEAVPDGPWIYSATFPEIAYGDIALGPARVRGFGSEGVYELSWSVLDKDVNGTARIDVPSRRYLATAGAPELDLAAIAPDSLLETYDVEGTLALSARASGSFDGDLGVSGEVTSLVASVRGEQVRLERPFSFTGTREGGTLTPMLLTGPFGDLEVGGSAASDGTIDIAVRAGDLDLAALDRLVRGRSSGPGVSGVVSGALEISGVRTSPVATINVSAESLSAGGIRFDRATIEADADTSMIVFALAATSGDEGTLSANGLVPVRPDSATFVALDGQREFALSLAADRYVGELGELLLRGTRGPKELAIDGSLLVTGLTDSLETVNGRGDIRTLSLSFAPAAVALADTFSFEIDNGDIWIDELALALTRTRVLSDEDGGLITISGFVGVRDSVDVTARVDSLDVATLFRVLLPSGGTPLSGRLELEASARGRLTAPEVAATWRLADPRIVGLGFDSFAGHVRSEEGDILVERASLVVEDDSLSVTGALRPADTGTDTAESSYDLDLRVVSDGLELSKLRVLPAGVSELSGVFEADVAVGGTATRPSFEGAATLVDGRFSGFGMGEPARGITLEIDALDRMVLVPGGEAKLGAGKITFDGSYDLDGERAFRARARLLSPEITVTDVVDATLGGKLTWSGTSGSSQLSGSINIERADVFHDISLGDLTARRAKRVTLRASDDPRSRVGLDLEIEIEDAVTFDSNLVDMELGGGVRLSGTALAPRPTGSFYTESGTFQYLGTEFEIRTFQVSWRDPRRTDPYITLVAEADVESRDGEAYSVTVQFDDYWYDGAFSFLSTPALSEPDIVALLTFGDTVGGVVSGGGRANSSRSSFSEIARKTFVGRVFGVAESTLKELLDLDVVAIEEETTEEGTLLAGAGLTVGKRFGRVAVSYSTAVGRFEQREVEVAFLLTDNLSFVTKADPEGNHAARIKLRIPIR